MENHKELIQQVKELVQANKTEKALDLLSKVPALSNEVIHLRSRYKRLRDDLLHDTISRADANREMNIINRSIIELSEKSTLTPTPIIDGPGPEPDNKRKKLLFYSLGGALVLLIGLFLFFRMLEKEPQPVLIDLFFKSEKRDNIELMRFPETKSLDNLMDSLLIKYSNDYSGNVDQWQLMVNQKEVSTPEMKMTLKSLEIEKHDTLSIVTKKLPPPPVVDKKYVVLGTLKDIFGNPLKDSIVNLSYNTEREQMSTDPTGFFQFSELEKSKSYKLQYHDDPPKIESVREKDTIATRLITNPLSQVDVSLHRKITKDMKIIGTFKDTKDRPILVPLDSLELDSLNQGKLYYVLRLFGSKDYSDITRNGVNLIWEHVDSPSETPYVKKIKKNNIQFCEWGWRNWGFKRSLFPGEWTLTIKTAAEEPQVIDKLTFHVVK